jgi:adenosylcobinamide-GDP ribazoletransferase
MDALRLAFGTLTVLPTPPPRVVDRRVGSWAMTLAPLVGLVLAVPAGLLLWLAGGDRTATPAAPPAPAAALTVALLAVLTRAMHLDGLADTADGLGSGKPAPQALEVMRKGDVGPFGVVTLVLVLLVQVLALAELVAEGRGVAALVPALVASRLVLPVVCLRGVPAARRDGLGQAVAGTVSWGQLLLAVGLAAAVTTLAALVAPGPQALEPGVLLRTGAAAAVALAAGLLLLRRCVVAVGGVTGDVLGACVEVTFTVALVALTVLA